MKVAAFAREKIKPSRCKCREPMSFNVPSVARHIRDSGIDNFFADATIRHFN